MSRGSASPRRRSISSPNHNAIEPAAFRVTLDVDGRWVWRILTVTRTGEKVVKMPLAPRVAPPLTWRSAPSRGAIFVNSTGERLDRHAAERIVRGSPDEPGRQACRTPHFAHAALDAGVLLRDVQDAASDADPRATMR
jgi:integrase/recombinase XerD